jgi:hypothetical protein
MELAGCDIVAHTDLLVTKYPYETVENLDFVHG